ncbi:hypothetical protein SAMN05421878_1361 [Actinobaculum suis]|uniref:Uncharacterized protein n=1 Tax=Actinobaculum suis TaxID=1657 RepID=A0A1G7F1B0_9ACTO|nr:hypothetical protein [Actinobaculum suis]MDY5152544.1 hypothetical protein [Actinobaculum suis]SDE69733.1 hypothetical protein SAMN05421878_1361 [Actinobaculum suis]
MQTKSKIGLAVAGVVAVVIVCAVFFFLKYGNGADSAYNTVVTYGDKHSTSATYQIGDGIGVDGLPMYDDAAAASENWEKAASDEVKTLTGDCQVSLPVTADNFNDWWKCAMDHEAEVPATLWHFSRLQNTFHASEVEASLAKVKANPSSENLAELAGLLPGTEKNTKAFASAKAEASTAKN